MLAATKHAPSWVAAIALLSLLSLSSWAVPQGARTQGLVAPAIQDNVPEGFTLAHLVEEYPIESKMGWTIGVKSGPFISGDPLAAKADLGSLPYGASCQDLEAALDKWGLDGTLEIAHWSNWHPLGQIVGARAISDKKNLTALYSMIQEIAIRGANALGSEFAYGIWHASAWYIVGTQPTIDGKPVTWDTILDTICPRVESSVSTLQFYGSGCLHSVSHGWLIRYTQPDFDKCGYLAPFGTGDLEKVDRGYAQLVAAPTEGIAHFATNGFFHGVIEKKMDPPPKDWFFPCDRYAISQHCFFWVHLYGLNAIPGMGEAFDQNAWRGEAMVAKGKWPTWCLSEPTFAEETIRNCIYGQSAVFFPVYDHAAALRNTASIESQPTIDVCYELPSMTIGAGDVYHLCDLIYEQTRPTRYSRTTLLDFCLAYTPQDHVQLSSGLMLDGSPMSATWTDTQQRRWLACIHGALVGPSSAAKLLETPAKTLDTFCQQFLNADFLTVVGGEGFGKRSYEICMRGYDFSVRDFADWELDDPIYAVLGTARTS